MSENYSKKNAEISIAAQAVGAAAETLLKTVTALADDVTKYATTPAFATDIAEAFWAFDIQQTRIKNELAAFEKLTYGAIKERVRALVLVHADHPVDAVDDRVINAFYIGEKPVGSYEHMDPVLKVVREKDWEPLSVVLARSGLHLSNGAAITRALRKYLRAFVDYRNDPTIERREAVCSAARDSIDASIEAIEIVESRAVRVDYLREFFALLAR